MNKEEIEIYRRLEVIDDDMYRKHFEKGKRNKNPINILNTVGKNALRKVTSLYLTSLPNRPPEYYQAIAVSLFKHAERTLNLSTMEKDKQGTGRWFADERIEQISHEVLLSEIHQIIHRTKIREISSTEPVQIYIATNSSKMIESIRKMFNGHHFEYMNHEEDLSFESKLYEKVNYLRTRMFSLNIQKPTSIGRIEESNAVKSFINPAWRNERKREIIKKVFNDYGMEIFETPRGEKRVKWLESNKDDQSSFSSPTTVLAHETQPSEKESAE